ncbi:MAG: flagellar motor protein [Bryobacterales bacterium]|nr:flagellar motor protein [Bryobacterales bacterium]
MPRRKAQAAHANHERWLVSYADFITLLFAFFVVMFASSNADRGRAAQVSESVKKAFGPGQIQRVIAAAAQPKDAAAVPSMPTLDALRGALKVEIDTGMVQVSLESRGLVISLKQASFFPSGQDNIDANTYAAMEKLASQIRNVPNKVRLEGHTDADPIRNGRFPSNWELSAARSVAVLNLFRERYEIPASRFSVAGYADTIPIAANDTPENKARNRRVDIVILNETGEKEEPRALVSQARNAR